MGNPVIFIHGTYEADRQNTYHIYHLTLFHSNLSGTDIKSYPIPKFNRLLMRQNPFFSTICIESKKERGLGPRSIVPLSAQKFNADSGSEPTCSGCFPSSRKISEFPFVKKINSPTKDMISNPATPHRTWSRDDKSKRRNYCSRLTGKTGNPSKETIRFNGSLFLLSQSPIPSSAGLFSWHPGAPNSFF